MLHLAKSYIQYYKVTGKYRQCEITYTILYILYYVSVYDYDHNHTLNYIIYSGWVYHHHRWKRWDCWILLCYEDGWFTIWRSGQTKRSRTNDDYHHRLVHYTQLYMNTHGKGAYREAALTMEGNKSYVWLHTLHFFTLYNTSMIIIITMYIMYTINRWALATPPIPYTWWQCHAHRYPFILSDW